MKRKTYHELVYPNAPIVRQYLEEHYPRDVAAVLRGLQPASADEFILIEDPINAEVNRSTCLMSDGSTFSFMFNVNEHDKIVYFYVPLNWNQKG